MRQAGVRCRRRLLVVALAGAAFALPLSAAGAAQSPDFPKYVAINKAMATLAGLQAKGLDPLQALNAAIGIAARQQMVTPAGQQYQLLALQFMGASAAADACIDIVKANPTIKGVNDFLICIAPINAALVALQNEMGQYDAQIATNSSPVTGPGPPPALGPANGFVAYAQVVGTVSEVSSQLSDIKDWVGKAEDVIKIGANGMADVVLPEGAVYSSNLTNESVVIWGSDTVKDKFAEVVGNANLPDQVQSFLNSNPPQIPDVSSNFGGGYVGGPLAFRAHASGARAAQRILVAKAKPNLPLAVGYAPGWLRTFTTALLNGRAAEEAQIAALVGTAPRVHKSGPILVRLRGADGLNAKAARALEAVLALEAARPAKLEGLNAALRARPVVRAKVRALAAALAKSYAAEPPARAAAARALAPPSKKGFHILAVVSAPFYADVSPRRSLVDPKRDAANRRLAAFLRSLAR